MIENALSCVKGAVNIERYIDTLFLDLWFLILDKNGLRQQYVMLITINCVTSYLYSVGRTTLIGAVRYGEFSKNLKRYT